MTRIVEAANQTETAKTTIRMGVLADLEFPSGTVSIHDGVGTVVNSYGSPTLSYLGVGQFGGIDGPVQEATAVIARPIKLSLSGVAASIVATAMTEDCQGQAVTLSLGYFDVDSGALVAAPQIIWEGRMDYMEVDLNADNSSVSINCEHRLRREPRIARYTDENQQSLHPGDPFFAMLPYIQGFKSQWGDKPSSYGASFISDAARYVRARSGRGG